MNEGMSGDESWGEINPFVTNLSLLNIIFSFTLTIFSFTIVTFLSDNHENVLYVGYGLSIGEAAMLITLLPQGHFIDKGYSFFFMSLGSIVFGFSLLFLYYVIILSIFPAIFIPVLIAFLIISQGTFRASLNGFIAKAVSKKFLGKNYARILTMETVGTAISFIVLTFVSYYSHIGLSYLFPGIVLVIFTILVFSVLSAGNRDVLKLEEKKTPRPSVRESLSRLKEKRGFLAPLISAKVLMTFGIIGFTYFYVSSGVYLGIPLIYVFLTLFVTYVLAGVSGKVGEMTLERYKGRGKKFITLAMFVDVVTFGLIILALHTHNIYEFIAAALISSPGPYLISGGLSYEVHVIGRENRGIFGGIQRVSVGAISIPLTLLLTYFYVTHLMLMWEVVFAASIASLVAAALIPGKFNVRLGESAASL